MCCVCAGSCSHVGNHSYCSAHDMSYAASPPPIGEWPVFLPRCPRPHYTIDLSPGKGRHRKDDDGLSGLR